MRTSLLVGTVIPILSGAIAACGAGVDPNAGATSSSSSSSTGGSSSSSTGGPGSTLYQRLGGQLGIRKLVDQILANELKDADIASFFFFQVTSDPAHPSIQQISDCLSVQLAEASGGPQIYTGHVSAGFTCRPMAAAHQGLEISAKTFDKFVTIAAGVLKTAGVADADIATIGTVLNGTKKDISSANGVDKFTPPKN